MSITVIVPFHRNRGQLDQCLAAVRGSDRVPRDIEILVAADGNGEACADVAGRYAARVMALPAQRGPAAARNAGAWAAQGTLLAFVDSDVVVHADAIARMVGAFDADPGLAAVFGSYDDTPADPGFVSQAKNLSHAYIHRQADRAPTTFWAGLGAVRAGAFRAVGGFDERFARPSVEDIELGYRLTARGYRMRIDPDLRGSHLKRWSWLGAIRSDVLDRGIPWTRLLHRYGALRNDLNLTWSGRVCVILAWVALGTLLLAWRAPWLLLGTAASLALLWWNQRAYYAWLARRRGVLFAVRWFPFQFVHHALNAVSFLVGTTLHVFGAAYPGPSNGSRLDERSPAGR